MSSLNACGVAACVLSALEDRPNRRRCARAENSRSPCRRCPRRRRRVVGVQVDAPSSSSCRALALSALPQSFNVKIDAADLAPGAHARVEAFDATDDAGGLPPRRAGALYVRRPDKAAPSWVDPGDVMVGSINLGRWSPRRVRAKVPRVRGAAQAKADGDDDDDDDDGDDLSDEEKDAKALLEALMPRLKALDGLKGADPLSGATRRSRRRSPRTTGPLPLLRAVLDDAVKRGEGRRRRWRRRRPPPGR
ncbi:tripeptidyl-peptidase [Aureococcus anophagefferens]|nr:tripeptidyl-peptidase [Aureococcus anophagefferens]